MVAKLEQLASRLTTVELALQQPDVTGNLDNYRKLTREASELTPVVAQFQAYQKAQADLHAAQNMLSDPALKDFAQEEIDASKTRLAELEIELQKLLLPKDPNDDKNVFLEIRAGTGGDESALFAGDLLRMYLRYAERQRWQVERRRSHRLSSRDQAVAAQR